LKSHLPSIDKSIVIEGEGITLTKDFPYDSSGKGVSQMLTIQSTTQNSVTIRRVHFKNGQADAYGGAIRANNPGGTLTLESCIFSNNRTMLSFVSSSISTAVGRGGAVHSYVGVLLTIRGCTFYGNTAADYGGAVSGIGHVILTGNLFYGNTAASYPVVDGTGYGTTYHSVNASYNVTDVDFGTNGDQCGWIKGTGDTTFTALSIIDDPIDTTTFVPVSGLQNILTARPSADFPATDFYGATRTFPGAPGAVTAAPSP
jgi:hypothetical protein